MTSSANDAKKTVRLDDYAPLIGAARVGQLRRIADQFRGRSIQMVNSTRFGGGVAEILHGMIPLLHELGIETHWEVIGGDPEFFALTKTIFNALHGHPMTLTPRMREHWEAVTDQNARKIRLDADCVIIHDHQPIGMIPEQRPAEQKWLWRCHVDVSEPDPTAWKFVAPYAERYDGSVFSAPAFARPLRIPQFMVPPSINPLSDKNREQSRSFVREVLHRFGIDEGRPILTQISRFDRLKDPFGVVAAYRQVKKRHDCQLVLAGGGAADDPEGAEVLARLREYVQNDPDVHILELPPTADLEINALQRASTVLLQKSLREGFALTVTEALFKKKPVVASAVGGIPLQVLHGVTGLLVHSIEGAAYQIGYLLDHPAVAARLGQQGYKHVCEHFLLTRHLRDYLVALLAMGARPSSPKQVILKDRYP